MDASHRHRPPRVIVPSDPSSEHRRASSGWGQIREAFSEFRPTLGEALRARVLYPFQPSFSLPKAPVVLIMRQHISDVNLVRRIVDDHDHTPFLAATTTNSN